ncbi:MAG: hypothetical protein JSW27_16830 [Phycisphaerales bacterium]|nr:MAG: hypothetical protein JSW27_16830 [Phycisphaerales bacterium]
MESKITKYSAAATILVAASLVLFDPFGLLGRQSIVLAEVAQKTSAARTVMHRETRVAYRIGEAEPFRRAEVQKYVSDDIGFVEEQYDPNGALMHRGYFLKETQKIIVVFPSSKKYVEMPAKGGFYDQLAELMAPGGFVNYFVSRDHTKLGRSHFDGIEAEGFETNAIDLSPLPDQMRFVFPVENLTGRLWIDVETSLPVGIEMDLTTGRGLMTGFRKIRGVFTAYDFQWNAELPEGIFEPNIPEDYTQIDLGSLAQDGAWLGVGALPLIGFVAHRWRSRRRHLGRLKSGCPPPAGRLRNWFALVYGALFLSLDEVSLYRERTGSGSAGISSTHTRRPAAFRA